ncbi:MAG: hypothetical protein JWN87_3249, partial [Frankiales bacterium]|nr:hypothetical protein [Frankiales bacterium]
RLTLVYATGSPALAAADRDRLTMLQRRHRTAVGVRHVTSAVTAVQASADRAELRVTEALGAYRLLDGRGRVVSQQPAGPVATRLVVLVRGPAGWRIQELRPPVIHGTGAPQ